MQIIQEKSPHIRRKDSVASMMGDVCIALIPVIIYSLVVYKLFALRNILLSVAVMELCEFIFVLIQNRIPYDGEKHSLKENLQKGVQAYHRENFLAPLVSALIFALIMPVETSPAGIYWVSMIAGGIFGMVIGKLVFGGLGQNIFNPAAVGMVFSKLCFSSYTVTTDPFGSTDAFASSGIGDSIIASSTSLSNISMADKVVNLSNYSLLELFLGQTPGLMGEACKLVLLLSLVYLIVRHTIDWRITLSYVGAFAILMLFSGIVISVTSTGHAKAIVNPFYFMTYQLLSGGLLFGAIFMATDPVTSPITKPGRVLYGVILAICTALIRLFGSYPEGVVFSILIGNLLTPMIDYYKWSGNKWNWKKIVLTASVFIVGLLIIIWALSVQWGCSK
ncbi:MAG: RnfABCDGE type electron transport complex subunit D [Bacilli bacterium]